MEKNYFNKILYSDVIPFELIKELTNRKVEIREMATELVTSAKLLSVGGFAAVHDNSTQSYNYLSDTNKPIITIRLHKNNQWYDSNGNRYVNSENPHRNYDYNF